MQCPWMRAIPKLTLALGTVCLPCLSSLHRHFILQRIEQQTRQQKLLRVRVRTRVRLRGLHENGLVSTWQSTRPTSINTGRLCIIRV